MLNAQTSLIVLKPFTYQHQLVQTGGKPEDWCWIGYRQEPKFGWSGHRNQTGTWWGQQRQPRTRSWSLWMTERKHGWFMLHWSSHSAQCLGSVKVYLDNGRVLRVRACWFGRFTHSQVLDVAASEDDVLKDVLTWWDGPISRPVLSAKGTDWRDGRQLTVIPTGQRERDTLPKHCIWNVRKTLARPSMILLLFFYLFVFEHKGGINHIFSNHSGPCGNKVLMATTVIGHTNKINTALSKSTRGFSVVLVGLTQINQRVHCDMTPKIFQTLEAENVWPCKK